MSRLPSRRAALLAALALFVPAATAVSASADGLSGQGSTDGTAAAAQAAGPAPSATNPVADGSADSTGTPQARIIGGAAIAPATAPWSVFLYSENPATNRVSTCGGAILSNNRIVTAAHCLIGVNVKNPASNQGLGVIAGLANYNSRAGSQERGVVIATPHPQWKGDLGTSSGGDIAVLTLDNPLTFGPNVQPIALPAPGVSVNGDPILPPTNSVLEAGYGDQDTTGHADGTIHQISSTIVDQSLCPWGASASILCTQTPNATPCHGDSGSALVAAGPTPVILGVVSAGPADVCSAGSPVSYTSLITPENRVFVDGGTPVIAPRQTDYTRWKTSGPFQTGSVLTCYGDNWSNGATVKWVVTNEAGALAASGFGASFDYTFQASDVGHTLACRSYASNAGGVGLSDRVPLTGVITQGPAPKPADPAAASGNGMSVKGPKAVGRGHSGTFKVAFATVPAGSTSIKVKISVNGKHGTSITKTYRIPKGSTAGSVTMKLRLSKRISTGTKTVTVAASTYFGKKKNGDTRKLTVKLKVKKK